VKDAKPVRTLSIFKTKKVRTLDEMFKKISESSENNPEQLAHTSENSSALSLSVFYFMSRQSLGR
jgi:hypothetical protein